MDNFNWGVRRPSLSHLEESDRDSSSRHGDRDSRDARDLLLETGGEKRKLSKDTDQDSASASSSRIGDRSGQDVSCGSSVISGSEEQTPMMPKRGGGAKGQDQESSDDEMGLVNTFLKEKVSCLSIRFIPFFLFQMSRSSAEDHSGASSSVSSSNASSSASGLLFNPPNSLPLDVKAAQERQKRRFKRENAKKKATGIQS